MSDVYCAQISPQDGGQATKSLHSYGDIKYLYSLYFLPERQLLKILTHFSMCWNLAATPSCFFCKWRPLGVPTPLAHEKKRPVSEVFHVPHQFQLDSSGFKWSPPESTGIFEQIWQRKCQYSTGFQWNGISYRVTAGFHLFTEGIYASGFHWIPLDSTWIQRNPV